MGLPWKSFLASVRTFATREKRSVIFARSSLMAIALRIGNVGSRGGNCYRLFVSWQLILHFLKDAQALHDIWPAEGY